MTDEQTRGVLLVVLGATAVFLWWTGDALNYVRPGLAPYLLVSGVVVLLLGLLPPLGLLGDQAAGHAGGHRHRGRVGWLLLVPVLVVMLVQPTALGSYAVSSRSTVPGGDGGFEPLAAPVRGAVPMSMAEFVTRALRDPGQSLAGVRVRLVGFVAPGGGAGNYLLTRFVLFCCAADAEALQAEVRGDPTPRARDQWLEVEGTWLPRPTAADDDPSPPPSPALHVDSVRPVAPARPPYEYSLFFGG